MRAVRMKVFSNGLNPGDLAGFDDEIAARMIARGEAVAVEQPRQMPVATAEQKVVVEKSVVAEKPADAAPVAPVVVEQSFRRHRR